MKNVFTCLVLLLLGNAVQAQKKNFQFGIQGGLNLSYLTVDKKEVPVSRLLPGGHIGFMATDHLSACFALQSGLFLTTKGGEFKDRSGLEFDVVIPGRIATLKSRQIYLQIPVYARYRIPLHSGTDILIHAGPYFAEGIVGYTRLHGDLLHGDAIFEDEWKEKTFADRRLKKFDYGIGAGIGIDLREVILSLNYEWGLKDIGTEGKVYFPFYNSPYKNRNLLLSLEYKFQ